MQFSPTPLGESLISAYRKMGLANLWLPTLRGVIERNITAVARGQRTKHSVLAEAVAAFKADFEAAQAQVGRQRAMAAGGGALALGLRGVARAALPRESRPAMWLQRLPLGKLPWFGPSGPPHRPMSWSRRWPPSCLAAPSRSPTAAAQVATARGAQPRARPLGRAGSAARSCSCR
jgi:hypothetical protein